jgi:hypothetical protein
VHARGAHATPKQLREESLEKWTAEMKAKTEEHNRLVDGLKALLPSEPAYTECSLTPTFPSAAAGPG